MPVAGCDVSRTRSPHRIPERLLKSSYASSAQSVAMPLVRCGMGRGRQRERTRGRQRVVLNMFCDCIFISKPKKVYPDTSRPAVSRTPKVLVRGKTIYRKLALRNFWRKSDPSRLTMRHISCSRERMRSPMRSPRVSPRVAARTGEIDADAPAAG
jgi:hypothetical protein